MVANTSTVIFYMYRNVKLDVGRPILVFGLGLNSYVVTFINLLCLNLMSFLFLLNLRLNKRRKFTIAKEHTPDQNSGSIICITSHI